MSIRICMYIYIYGYRHRRGEEAVACCKVYASRFLLVFCVCREIAPRSWKLHTRLLRQVYRGVYELLLYVGSMEIVSFPYSATEKKHKADLLAS